MNAFYIFKGDYTKYELLKGKLNEEANGAKIGIAIGLFAVLIVGIFVFKNDIKNKLKTKKR